VLAGSQFECFLLIFHQQEMYRGCNPFKLFAGRQFECFLLIFHQQEMYRERGPGSPRTFSIHLPFHRPARPALELTARIWFNSKLFWKTAKSG
jgi:hypothetical protein